MILFLIGILSGIIGGMGIGGGTILIPALIFFASLKQHQAQGINLITFIPMAIVALITHFANKNIEIRLSIIIICFGLVGAFIGSTIAVSTKPDILRKLFAIFLFLMGLYEIYKKPVK
ncbi:sulfite exporter TauE/SafE family protein [Caldisalinibacter kiritimatiensis]|uniref:Probable membrane transporter protein n=1 Tax=Caldisalinibacter kiritimatiensis TaxID=1304284 RepID=R1CPU4_9FIRM|nr:sulfite exporter TauE/SafE family protein [Caldisalinibacter kiritimatiensis]EOD00696.1 Protein of unknown function DUF81 [Caldisalinibacter kiritimatiensis]